MPAIYRTIISRIRKSIETHGIWGTLGRSVNAPMRFLREYRHTKIAFAPRDPDPFDVAHGVETSQRIHPSDLKTESDNWVYAVGYWPTAPELLRETLAAVPIRHELFTFIDLGSGKGRVLMIASDYPFAKIVGVEFAPSLHQIALENLRIYRPNTQKCRTIESRCEDMTKFIFPETPIVLFIYNPASSAVVQMVGQNLVASFKRNPRELWIIYVTPAYDIFEHAPFRKFITTEKYAIYRGPETRLGALDS